VKYVEVDVDGKPQRDWAGILTTWLGSRPKEFNNETIFEHGLRAGETVQLLALPTSELPTPFWNQLLRIRIVICYASVFDEYWMISDDHLGGRSTWKPVDKCPVQPPGNDL
jgi:hypothetical protein